MPKRWVDGLMLGTFYLPTGDVWSCDERARDYYFNRAKETLNDGVPLPVCLEHQPTVGLSFHEKLEEKTARTAGHCYDVRIGADGQIQWEVDCDDDDFKILKKNRFFSPEIRHNVINTRTGKRYPGPTVVHLASTPRPVQVTTRPHISLSSKSAPSLRDIPVNISLSSAAFVPNAKDKKKDASMPAPKNPADAAPPEETPAATPGEQPGEDMENAGKLPADDDAAPEGGTSAEEAKAMQELATEIGELGVEVHSSAHEDTLSMIRHLISAIKTHKATKNGGGSAEPKEETPDPNDTNSQPNQEGETTESAPIMMSANINDPIVQKLANQVFQGKKENLRVRIAAIHTAGWCDNAIKAELDNENNAVKLSLSTDGDLQRSDLESKVDILERLAKSGKPGPFAAKAPAPAPKIDPHKPISSAAAVQLSQTLEEETVAPGDADDDTKAQQDAGDDLAERTMAGEGKPKSKGKAKSKCDDEDDED